MRKLILAAIALLVLAGIGIAIVPPPPPPPPVPQNLGLADASIRTLLTNATDQSACRQCHQTTGTNISGGYSNTVGGVPTRHHSLLQRNVINPLTNAPFACQDCHPVVTAPNGNSILLDRSCVDCHNGTAFNASGAQVGNISRPHHVNTSYSSANIGNPAAARQCNFCHGSFVNNYNDGHYKPSYTTDFMITPFASFKATSDVPNNITGTNIHPGNKTWGGCYSCHEAHPEDPEIENLHDTHHVSILGYGTGFQTTDTPFNLTGGSPLNNRACFVCHVITWNFTSASTSPLRINIPDGNGSGVIIRAMELRNSTIEATSAIEPGTTNITFNGTGCEKCHGVQSLHNIQFEYQQNGPQGKGHINNNTDCQGCHASWVVANDFVPGPIIPDVNSVSPSVIAVGRRTTLTIKGLNLVNEVTLPDGTVKTYTSVVSIDGEKYRPTSITDSQIVVRIPALKAGVYKLQLVKDGDTLSRLSTLTVVPKPIITSAYLRAGVVTITGTGFGANPATNAQYYVSIEHAGKQIVSTAITSWSNTQIKARIPTAAKGDIVTVITKDSGEATTPIK